ncbi:low affinity immunoglobulin epsilon Fc receptor-like [Corticium candelabrum]|uniref:low affinity immunoglobulin epsilon Fc receptor-like n=1 Tax=Corticium candelabrum TaxID=121492 RepID=UPI002E255B8B|nr:low affinity immunoglobulin epsilon Fc receptor-like [Corticium candelabrum]
MDSVGVATLVVFLLIVQALPASSMQCQAGWTRSEMSCYLLVSTSKEWNDAEIDCITKGGHLTSIASVSESSVVLSFRGTSSSGRNDAWIGLHDQVVENTFVWSDGTSSTYINWDPATNEPNSSGECVRIRFDGKWKDHRCTASYPHVYAATSIVTTVPAVTSKSVIPTATSPKAILSTSPTTAEGVLNLSTTRNVATFLSVTIPSTSTTASLSTATASGTQWPTRDSTSRSRHTSVPLTTTDSTKDVKSSKTSSSATTSRSNVKPSKRMIHLTRAIHPTLLAVSTPSQASTNNQQMALVSFYII